MVELLLAHAERNKVTAAYHHHELADERRRALQYLADQIDRLAIAAPTTVIGQLPQGERLLLTDADDRKHRVEI